MVAPIAGGSEGGNAPYVRTAAAGAVCQSGGYHHPQKVADLCVPSPVSRTLRKSTLEARDTTPGASLGNTKALAFPLLRGLELVCTSSMLKCSRF